MVCLAQEEARGGLETDITEVDAARQGTLAGYEGSRRIAHHQKGVGHGGADPPQPTLIAQCLSEGRSLVQVHQDALALAEKVQRTAQVESYIDSLL
jgi:hypothetical protein